MKNQPFANMDEQMYTQITLLYPSNAIVHNICDLVLSHYDRSRTPGQLKLWIVSKLISQEKKQDILMRSLGF